MHEYCFVVALDSRVKSFSKSALLTAAVACVSTGVNLLDSDIFAGAILIALGLGLIFSYAVLLEKQAAEAAIKALRKESYVGKRYSEGDKGEP